MPVISTNAQTDELVGLLRKVGEVQTVSTDLAWREGFDRNRLYKWEVIQHDRGYVLVHTFPDSRMLKDVATLLKMREATKAMCNMNLRNTMYLAEWVNEVDSFCISFTKVPHWRDLSLLFLDQLEKDFYKRLY